MKRVCGYGLGTLVGRCAVSERHPVQFVLYGEASASIIMIIIITLPLSKASHCALDMTSTTSPVLFSVMVIVVVKCCGFVRCLRDASW